MHDVMMKRVARRIEKWRFARLPLSSLLFAGFACATILSVASFAQANSPLNFGNNFFVTGDYVVGGAYFMNTNIANGYATGTITIPDVNPGITGQNFVPVGAEVVAAVLYWQTVEKSSTVPGQAGSGENGFFSPVFIGGPATGYPLTGVNLTGQSAVPYSPNGCSATVTGEVVRTYRANVLGALPRDSTGNIAANGVYEVRLPSVINSTPYTLGASLVLIYRILSPSVPLKSIVIYDGAFGQNSSSLVMTQPVQGFYQAAATPFSRLTHIVGGGHSNEYQTVYLDTKALPSLYGSWSSFPGYYGTWDNPTWTFGAPYPANPMKANDSSATTEVVPYGSHEGCVSWGAVIVSTTVQNSDGDGLLDVWKQTPANYPNPGYCDAAVNGGVCVPGSSSWVDLPGAKHGEKDVFVQLDYMCSAVTGTDSCTTGDGTNYSFDPRPSGAVALVTNGMFAAQGVHVHVNPAGTNQPDIHAIQETTCTDNLGTSPPSLCAFPVLPGVVVWKGGFDFYKNQLVDPTGGVNDCTASPAPADCTPRFQPGKRSSWHYVLFAHAVGRPQWALQGGTLISAKQSGNTVTFTTSTPVGTLDTLAYQYEGISTTDPYCPNGRVTVVGAATNSNLDGTFCVNSPFNPAGTSFTITVAGSATTANYTYGTDPSLAVATGQVNSTSGFSDVGGGDSVVTLGLWGNPASPTSDGQREPVIAGTFAHEFGHSNGLTHGGFVFNSLTSTNQNYTPTIYQNCAPNHQSIMNYSFQVDLLSNGSGTNVPDYSGQKLNTLNKSVATSNPFTTTPTYLNTNWYVPYAGVGTAASQHCNGTPITNGAQMSWVTGPTASLLWKAGQDINFDGNTSESLPGFNDWANIDFRQIGATSSNSIQNGPEALFNGGGPQFNGGGPQFNGGGPQFNGGGPQFNGGGPQFNGGGEIDVATVNSFTRPPQNLTDSEGVSPRTITLNWTAPTFGQIGEYKIYQSAAGGAFAVVATVTGTPPVTTDTVTVNCNPGGYSYFVTAVLAGTTQESVGSNTVSLSGATGKPLTGCYTNTGPGSVALTNLAFTDTSSANTPVQGDNIQITWSLNTDDSGVSVTRAAASSALVAIGPIPSDATCSSLAKPPEYLGYSGTYPYPVTTLSSAGSGITGSGNPFAFTWNTTNANAGCYFFELDLDSHQYEQSSALELLIYVSDSNPHVTTTALPNGTVGNAYSNTIYESGGTSPFTWTYTGSLPTGFTLGASTGTVSGTTCVAGGYSFTTKVTDKNSNYGTQGLTLQINQASTATTVGSSLNASTYGQAVTFTATVSPQYSCTPTGTVTFYDGATAISGAITLTSGTATFTTTALQLAAGPHSITAHYSGDSNFYAYNVNGSTAPALSQVVNQATTTSSVTSSLNPSTYGQAVTFNATVAPQYAGTPTGTVIFEDGGVALVGASTVALSNGTASFTTTNTQLVAKNHSITAVYSGDPNFYATGAVVGSTATVLSQTVKPAMTATSVSSSLDPSTYGDSVTFTAIVSNASSTAVTPTGSVQFVIDSGSPVSGTPITCPPAAPTYSLCATASTSSLTVMGSPHSVQANYINTDGDFTASSATLMQMVNSGQSVQKADTTATLAVSSGSSNLGDTVSLTATVADASGGSTGTPTGLVTFLDGTTPIATGVLNGGASDQATFTTSLLSVGVHNLAVVYNGDANFNATGADANSTATGATETVALRSTTTAVALNPTTVQVGQGSTTTVTVTDNGTTNPAGTADSWIATSGTPAVGTTGSTATLFADGMVLVAGGTNANGTVVASASIYNAVSATFTATTGSLNTARTGATATLLGNGEVLIAGGSSDGTATNALNTAELYNPVTGAFIVAGSGSGSAMTAARFGATATLLTNGQVLIAGGQNSGGALNAAELYNPATDTFTATGPLGTARYDAAAVLLANGIVLIAGGTGGSGTLNSAELYAAGTFTSASGTMTAARTGPTATLLLNGNVLVAGGSSDGTVANALNTAEIYNTAGATFFASSSTLNTPRFNGTATPLPTGMVLLVGGASGTTAELYDPDGDKFDATGSLLNTDQPSLTATLLNNDHVLITGLTSGGSPVADDEIYTPSFNPLGTVALSSSDTNDAFGGTCVLTPGNGSPAASTCTTTVTPSDVGTSPHTITGTYPADAVHSGGNNTAPLTVGACTSNCPVGAACTGDANCASNACDGNTLTCDANQCSDNRRDGNETDIDCGGGTCPACPLNKGCVVDSDCASNACDALAQVCVASQCADHRQDGNETDVDCGGGTCPTCSLNQSCMVDSDCTSNFCYSGVCQVHP